MSGVSKVVRSLRERGSEPLAERADYIPDTRAYPEVARMATMRAVVKRGANVSLGRVPVPDLANPDDIRLRVTVAGLCRTDLLVAAGKLPSADSVVLGHEFAGVVDAVGPAVRGLRPGDRVAVRPLVPFGDCGVCRSGDDINRPRR